MNYNMMCKRLIICMGIFLLAGFGIGGFAKAAQKEEIPEGDILIIYNDGADDDTLESVKEVVEFLTYQSFQVSYGPVSLGMEALENFSYVICYDVTKYPEDFLKNLKQYEDTYSGDDKEESPHILFAGSECLKEYLDYSGRDGDYEKIDSTIGKIQYSFDGLTYQTGIVKEDYFVFLKNTDYEKGSLTVNDKKGYFCARDGAITHIPETDINDNLVKAAFIKEVAQWKWPYNGSPGIYAQYIVINRVYPYQDPDKLFEIVKLLTDEKTPFVISVMPIYVNGDYPAMEHFCEILRYAQASGGAVIINAPVNQMNTFDEDTVLDYLSQALKIYNEHGVYPLALQVPSNWMFNEDTIDIMSHFKTIFTSREEDPYIEESDMRTNLVYKDGHQWVGMTVDLDDLGTSYLSAYSTAVPISLEADIEDIKEIVQSCLQSSIPLKSLWDMEHSYWTKKNLMTYKNKNLILDDKKIDLSFVPSTYTDKYNYHRNMLERFSADLTSQNRKLIILVGVTSFLFLFFIFLARYNNRRNYFFRDGKKDGKEKKKNRKDE